MSILCCAHIKATAQIMSAEQNNDGSITINFGGGNTITTNTSGQYTASGVGFCSSCANELPPVTVYGYQKPDNTYNYTAYNYKGQYYQLPPSNQPPLNYTPVYSIVVNTNPAIVPMLPPAPPVVVDPCKGRVVAGGGSNDPNRLTQPTYGAAITSLTSTLSTDVNEKSALIGVNTSNGNGQLEARINPAGTSGNTGIVNVNQPNYIATGQIHTHTSVAYPTPSAGDIYNLAAANGACPSFSTMYVLAADGSTYALVVTDPIMAASFLTNHPAATTITGDMWTNNGTPLWNDFKSVYKQVNPSDATPAIQDQAFEEAQAYILDAYNTGIGLFKLDANGNFKEVHTVKSTDANGQATYSKFNCN